MARLHRRLEGVGTVTKPPTRPHLVPNQAAMSAAATAWQRQHARLPAAWAQPAYVIDQSPYRELFTQNANYQPGRCFDFGPPGQDRMRAETAWWLWTCWDEGLRKVEPSMLRWWSDSIATLAAARAPFATSSPAASIADFDPALVVRQPQELPPRRVERPRGRPARVRRPQRPISLARQPAQPHLDRGTRPRLRRRPLRRRPVVGPRHVGPAHRRPDSTPPPRTGRTPAGPATRDRTTLAS